MDKITDEMLVAYADGELDDFETEQLEIQLAADPELTKRLEVFSKTGRVLASVFEDDMHQPIPKKLLDMLYDNTPPEVAHSPDLKKSVKRRVPDRYFAAQEGIWQAAIAASLALLIGTIMGWQINEYSRSGGKFLPASIVAQGAFQQTLESEPSGHFRKLDARKAEGRELKPLLTFVNRNGGFCREYQLANEGGRSFFGVACRSKQGAWQVKVHVPGLVQKSTDSKIIPASRRQAEAVDTVVDDLIAGDVLPLKEEASILNRWNVSPAETAVPKS